MRFTRIMKKRPYFIRYALEIHCGDPLPQQVPHSAAFRTPPARLPDWNMCAAKCGRYGRIPREIR
jgi:hypothetical protein